ncbi:MMPL family transporter [Salarchaeum sp. III]
MEQVASENESFNQTLTAADTDGDGVPDQNLAGVYDKLFAVAPQQAAGVIEQSDSGNYEAARLVISTDGGASGGQVMSEIRAMANSIETESSLTATATGDTIVSKISQNRLLDSVIQSLAIALAAILGFLMIAYRASEGSATLGAVTVLPVVFSVT